MKRFRLQHIAWVWLFIAMLIAPYVAKSVHIQSHASQHASCDADHDHTEHDCEHCMLCHFSFYSFLLPEELHLTIPVTPVFSVQFTELQKGYNYTPYTRYTRGPPHLDFQV